MKPHLPVFLFRSLLTCLATGITFATSFSYASEQEEEEEHFMLLSAEYPNGSITYTEQQMSALTLSGYESICFKEISSSGFGGAINTERDTFTLSGNGDVTFIGNMPLYASVNEGGAISNYGTFTLSGNDNVIFNGNKTSSFYDSYGGAICNSGTFTLSGNADVSFSGNMTSSYARLSGGAIFNRGSFTLSANGNVLFEKNAEVLNGYFNTTCRLRSIYSGYESTLNLSAPEGKSILFRDSVYASGTVNLNYDGTGDIIFSGATTEADLREVNGGAVGSDAGLQRSLISQLLADVTLGGGSLQVQEGAKLTVGGLSVGTASQMASLQLQNGWVDVSMPLTLSSGSFLSFSGSNYLLSSGIIAEGNNTLNIQLSHESQESPALTVVGNLANASNIILHLEDLNSLTGSNYHILRVIGDSTGWKDAALQLSGGELNELTWVNGNLYYHYDASLLPSQLRTEKTITQRLSVDGFEMLMQNKALLFDGASSGISSNEDYAVIIDNGNVSFSGNTGGAINNERGTFTLIGNGDVSFRENSGNSGGAILNVGSFTLSENRDVFFSKNLNSSSGGAILNVGVFSLCGNGEVSFCGNKTTSCEGGAIGNYGAYTLNGNGAIAFTENSSSTHGGAIYNKSIFSLKDNEDVIFIGNTSSSSIAYGGAICNGIFYDSNGTFELRCNGNISFCGNMADYGGAISNSGTSTFMLDDNGDICFSSNTSASNRDSYGGAIFNDEYAAFSLNNNGDVTFSGNKATYGSAILNRGSFTLSDNGNVSFCENSTSSLGAISNSGSFTLSGNGDVSFSGNVASSYYGAAAIYNDGTFSLRENGNIAFIGNTASSGRAILNSGAATFMLENNGDICFSNNTATITANVYLGGGAIYNSRNFTLSSNREVSFIENISSSSSLSTLGGAICNGSSYATFTLSENGNVTFIGNTSSFSSTSSSYAVYSSGGAIYNSGSFDLNGNGAVSFINNTASSAASFFPSFGGAIRNSGTFALRDNGEVSFIENTASYGGAIYNSDSFMVCGNGNVTFKENTSSSTYTGGAISNSNNASFSLCGNMNITFSGNTASSDYHNPSGGAILNEYDATFTLSGNGDVLFEKNAEIDHNGTYCLRSVYSRGTLNLSASEGKRILFKDSVCAIGTVNLNQEGLGDITFTGISTEPDLREVKGGIDGTAQEILNSRCSVLDADVTLGGGTLWVENSADLMVKNLTMANGTKLVLSEAAFSVTGTARLADVSVSGKSTLTAHSQAKLSLQSVILNSGTLTIGGTLDVSALTLNSTAATHVDVNGTSGASGFAKDAVYAVTLVDGGSTVNGGATIKHGSRTLTLGTDGVARSGGAVNYGTYLLTGNDAASTSAIHAKGASAVVSMNGGTLTVNDTASVNATAGTIFLAGGTMNGTLSGTTITATYGSVAATLTGHNTLIGNNYAVQQVLSNSGTLAIVGTLDVSALTLNSTATTHVDVNGNSGASGFARDVVYSVKLVNGGTVVNNGATVKHGSLLLTLGRDGMATAGGSIDYGTYLLTGTSTATTTAIHGKSSNAVVSMNGGTLMVNDIATVNATAGKITLSGGTLNGALSGTTITATNGTIAAALSGNNTLIGSSYALKNVISNSGTLTIGGTLDVSALTLKTTAATHIDVNGNCGASGFSKTAVYSVQLVNGGITVNNKATIKHGTRTLTLGSNGAATSGGTIDYGTYLLTGPATATTSAIHGKSSTAIIQQTGGTLTVNDTATVNAMGGTVVLSSGTLDGSLNNVTVNAAGGTLAADMRGGKLAVNGTVNLLGNVRADIELIGGRLTTPETLALLAGQELSFSGGRMTGDVLTGSGSALTLINNATLIGDLTLDGGQLTLNGNTLAVAGALNLESPTQMDISAYCIGTHKLFAFGVLEGRLDNLVLSGSRYRTSMSEENGALMLTVKALNNNLTWNQPKGTWSNLGSFGSGVFRADDDVNFRSAANVTISGTVAPGSVSVNTPGNVVLTADKKVYGSGISGEGSLTKSGAGMLTLNAGNTYTGGTELNAGTLKATAVDSFGMGEIVVKGGTLDLGGKAVANDIVLCGTATLKGDAKYAGAVTVEGNATLLAKTAYKGMTTIGSGSSLTLAEKVTMAGNLVVDGTLRVRDAKGLTLAKNQTLTLDNGGSVSGLVTIGSGGTLVWEGGSFAAAPVLKGGTLDLSGEGMLTLTGSKAAVQLGDKRVELPGKGIVYTDETLAVNSGTVTLNAVSGYAGSIEVKNGASLKLAGKEAVSNAITVSGNAAVANGKTHVGDITVNGTLAKGTNITIAEGRTVELNGAGPILGTIAGAGTVEVNASIDATAAKITAAHLRLNSGTFTNTKGIKLAKGQTLSLGGVTLDLGAKGALATAAGSTLVVSGSNTLSGSLTLGGGELVFAGGSLDVDGTLTLGKAMTVTGSGVITYTALKPFKGDIAALFGGADVALDTESCTLTITGAEPLVTRMAPAPLDAAPAPLALTPVTNPVADAMVQADWGILDANRAFAGAVNSRHQHAALLDKGRGAAWVSTFGSSVRHGKQGMHHGSDGNIEGAAFGLEHAVSDTASLGLAVGRSKNRLAATGVTHLRQETAHVALYGQKQLKHGFTAEATAAYGDTETKLGSASWTQKSAALTARLTHAQQLTDATAFRTFGGFSYEATEAGSLGTAHTGSVQNLRAELGLGATHTVGKAHLYAEAALTGDVVRHNPTVDFGGTRTHGANPGRLGIRATVGGIYEFSDTWSGTASYGIETESRSTAHTLNIGVSKSF